MTQYQYGILTDLKDRPIEIFDLNIEQLNQSLAPEAVEETNEEVVEPVPELETEPEAEPAPKPGNDSILVDAGSDYWMSKLTEDEVFNGPDGPAPRLHGLRRLAKPFIIREESRVNQLIVVPREIVRTVQTFNSENELVGITEQIGHHHFPMASVTFFIEDINGRTFSDSADAYYSNCNELGHFPTAVASTRAEARALRKLLGIKQHAAEELATKEAAEELAPEDDSPIKPEQAKLIDKILGSLTDFSLKNLLEMITIREIFTVEELTTGEARKALRLLNDQKKKHKRKANKK